MKHFKRSWMIGLTVLLMFSMAGAQVESGGTTPDSASTPALQTDISKIPEPPVPEEAPLVTLNLDRTALNNGGEITISGKVPAGKPVFIEVWAEQTVKASRFDSDPDKETGKRPYILYMTEEMPAYYKIFMPKDRQAVLDAIKKEGGKWSFSKALKATGAEDIYAAPGNINIDRCQATLMGSIVGSRGELLADMDGKENSQCSKQLVKARFRSPEKVMGADVDLDADGRYQATINIRKGAPPGRYMVVASVDPSLKSKPAEFENTIQFPTIYLSNAGTSLNLLGPFFLTLAVSIFGVLMGAGGGFILNPLLLSIWPLPHTIVAGTVMPTVLFSQASGIVNYSKIKFIHWKLGISIGLAMVAGGFIGPKLTELITLDQFKFVFGWILIVLAGLMFWQTTPGYLEKNKKEQAILKEFKKKAEEAAKARARS